MRNWLSARLCAVAVLVVLGGAQVAEAGPLARLFGRHCHRGHSSASYSSSYSSYQSSCSSCSSGYTGGYSVAPVVQAPAACSSCSSGQNFTVQSYSAQSACVGGSCGYPQAQPVRNAVAAVGGAAFRMLGGAVDSLAEVNAMRARRGLRPFIPDPLLTQGAMACADARASRRLHAHTGNDFAYLPPGAHARAGGCEGGSWGYGAEQEWSTCCTFENYTYAGAASVVGPDGKRYMQLFVR